MGLVNLLNISAGMNIRCASVCHRRVRGGCVAHMERVLMLHMPGRGIFSGTYRGQQIKAHAEMLFQRTAKQFHLADHRVSHGYDWVGWRNDSLGWAGKPVEMVFEFDSVRNFSSMVLHTNNMFSKDVQVFVHAKVFFSIGGQHFTGEPVQFSYMPDTVMENARDVTIKLHHRVGRYVQIHLYFALRWIMLSEISFTSGKFMEVYCHAFLPLIGVN
uniref:Discoidin domain-containing protein n=1 Tax=Anopheles culicifacies TaxID=139723 RepID=A0A182MEP5_9DIPT